MLVPFFKRELTQISITSPVRLFIVGATGSIGRSTLDIVRAFPERFKVVALTAGKNYAALLELAKEFHPEIIGVSNLLASQSYQSLSIGSLNCKVLNSNDAILEQIREGEYDVLVAAASGFIGLESVLAALDAGKRVALANKESLVAGGKLVTSSIRRFNGTIVPIDSEHSAIYQSIQGSNQIEIESITLTASGGPFLKNSLEELKYITPEQAIKHPKWSMGRKISVDSATMFNKGLELIEAYWLFGVRAENIEVVIHPQSILHSMVNFRDGSSIAQLSLPDMKGAISYAINYPNDRLNKVVPKLSLAANSPLEFLELDDKRFPAIELAKSALNGGASAAAVYNAANEAAVEHFLSGHLSFNLIHDLVALSLEQFGTLDYSTLDELKVIDRDVRDFVNAKVGIV